MLNLIIHIGQILETGCVDMAYHYCTEGNKLTNPLVNLDADNQFASDMVCSRIGSDCKNHHLCGMILFLQHQQTLDSLATLIPSSCKKI